MNDIYVALIRDHLDFVIEKFMHNNTSYTQRTLKLEHVYNRTLLRDCIILKRNSEDLITFFLWGSFTLKIDIIVAFWSFWLICNCTVTFIIICWHNQLYTKSYLRLIAYLQLLVEMWKILIPLIYLRCRCWQIFPECFKLLWSTIPCFIFYKITNMDSSIDGTDWCSCIISNKDGFFILFCNFLNFFHKGF